ncbi:MAG: phosphoribosylformylglycinamidine synthase I [Elusimicrobia bacterium]|nr:phosphoribosylformylglycinamidine synthase I [Elusimicrobiota bacterium]
MRAQALVLRTAGTNCDGETVHALKSAGADVKLFHLNEILKDPQKLFQFSILVVPGGFSYGDDVAAGKILANEIKLNLGEEIRKFVQAGKLIIGICNGFQVLVKAGLLPSLDGNIFNQTATLAQNDSGRFQCRWVSMQSENSQARWLKGMPSQFELPIAHGEGRFLVKDRKLLDAIEKNRQVIFRYRGENPNGSLHSIAGICNPTGNVIGLMPHPERFVVSYQHPSWGSVGTKEKTAGRLFWDLAVRYARSHP